MARTWPLIEVEPALLPMRSDVPAPNAPSKAPPTAAAPLAEIDSVEPLHAVAALKGVLATALCADDVTVVPSKVFIDDPLTYTTLPLASDTVTTYLSPDATLPTSALTTNVPCADVYQLEKFVPVIDDRSAARVTVLATVGI